MVKLSSSFPVTMLSGTPWKSTYVNVRRVKRFSALELITMVASMNISLFLMKSLAVCGSRVVRTREPFVETKDCTRREALVLIFDINALLIIFLRLAWSAVSLKRGGGVKLMRAVLLRLVAEFTTSVACSAPVVGDEDFAVMVAYVFCCGGVVTVVLSAFSLIRSHAMSALLLWMNFSSCSFISLGSCLLAKSSTLSSKVTSRRRYISSRMVVNIDELLPVKLLTMPEKLKVCGMSVLLKLVGFAMCECGRRWRFSWTGAPVGEAG